VSETAKSLFRVSELTGRALQIRNLGIDSISLTAIIVFCRRFEGPKIGETAAGERGPINSLFVAAPEERPETNESLKELDGTTRVMDDIGRVVG
jgi:hypothetical protein